jgi:arylsulfatase
MHWPDGLKTKSGAITTGRGHVVDLMATCIELAHADYPEEFAGNVIDPHESLSLVPLLEGRENDPDHPYLFNHSNTHAVVQGNFKIVREGKGAWALYNLSKERTEITNIASQHPEIVHEMARIWEARWGDTIKK